MNLAATTATADPILDYLFRRAIDYYPLLLLKEDERALPMWGYSGFTKIPTSLAEAGNIAMLIRNDSVLKNLLRGGGEVLTMRIEYELDSSFRVLSWLLNFCGDFLHGVFSACCYRGRYSLPDLLKEVELALETLRTIASGGTIRVCYFRGIYGLRLEPDALYDFGNNTTLRNIGDLANPLTQGTMSVGTSEEGNPILWGCVLEHNRAATAVPVDDSVQSWTFSWDFFEKLVDDLVMSIVLGGQHKRAPVDKTFTDIYLPLYRHQSGFRYDTRASVTCLDKEGVESSKHWFALLSTVDVEKVRIPLARIRAALYERTSPVDSLLDFFIAWESMFSARVSTTNSVVRSMEAMLKRSGSSTSRKRLNELYELRSEIVHGSSYENTHSDLLTPQSREAVRDEVCEVALIVLSELLKDKELLQLEAQQRVWRLLNPVEGKCERCKQRRLNFS